MQNQEIMDSLWLFLGWVAGTAILYLYLKNKEKEVTFRNLKSSFFLGLAIGLVAAFAGAKANISFWLTWVIFAGLGAYVTFRLLNKQADPVPGVYGKSLGRGLEKDEKIAWVVVRIVLTIVAVAFLVYGLFAHNECGIDEAFLSCRLTGTVFDYIGVLLFGGGLFIMAGLYKKAEDLTNPIGSNLFNNLLFAAMVAGVLMFWFL